MSAKPAKAATVSRLLVSKGHRRSEFHRSGMVRGYGTGTEGFSVEQEMVHGRRRVLQGSYRDGSPRYGYQSNNTPTGYVAVTYSHGSWSRLTGDEALASQREHLEAIAATLREAGYVVGDLHHKGTASLCIKACRVDEQGEVVVR